MNVLIVHRYFWPEEISTLPIMLKEVVNLHRVRGDKVTVVTGASKSNCEKWDEELKSAVNIRFFSSEIDRKLTNLGRVKNMIRLFFLAIRVMRKNEFDLLYTVSYPPGLSAALVAAVRLLRKKTKVIFYVQDILTYRLSSKLQRGIYEKMFSYSCRGAHKVITLTGDMENEISRICDSSKCEVKDKVVKIPNYSPDLYTTDEDLVSNGIIEDSDYSIDIVYAGNHGEAQNLGHFIKVLASDDSFNSLKVVFFGEGTSKSSLKQIARDHEVAIDFRDPVSREEINRIMADCTLGLVGARPGLMNYAFPSKLASYNAAGVPGLVMAEGGSSLAAWLAENQIGFCFDPSDVGKAQQELKTALIQTKGLDTGHVRKAAKRIYSLESYAEQFKNQIFSTLN